MPALAKKSDVLFGTEAEYEKAFGIAPVPFNIQSPTESFDLNAHEDFCKKVMAKAPECKYMFVALRNVLDAQHHVFIGLLYTKEGNFYVSKAYMINPVVDCVGCGDAFAAGLIYGVNVYPSDNQKALEFATAAAILKNTYVGDFNLSSAEQVEALIKGGGGNVAR